MAPRGTPKATPVVRRIMSKTNTIGKSSTTPVTKTKTMSVRKALNTKENIQETPIKEPPKSASKAPLTAKEKTEARSVQPVDSIPSSAKKPTWRRRPKPAHSGVPVPEKMKKLMEKYLKDDMHKL